MSSLTPGFINSIRNVMQTDMDFVLVDNTPRLLDLLNRSDKLTKLLNRRDSRGYTYLHYAAERNQPESLKCLLIKEANPNVTSTPTSNEVTPLHVAAGLGHLACLQLLIQSGGDVLHTDNQNKTPLEYASLNGQDLCLNFLHEELAKKLTVEAREIEDVLTAVEQNLAVDNLDTLTHWQLFSELFPLSMASDADLTQKECLLYRRCEINNSQDLVRVFSRLSKDIPLRLHDSSLLHAAARYGRHNLVNLLTEQVPQIALSMTSEGYNALHVAVAHHEVEVVKLLIEKQIRWTRRTRHLTASGSAHSAGIEGSGVEASLSHGAARFSTATMSGHSVLHFAVAVNSMESLFYLLKYHRELQLAVDSSDCGYTPLHLAVFLNRLELIRMLLTKGANPNVRIEQGVANLLSICRTPLAEAALNKNVLVVQLLLEQGAEDKHHDAIRKCVPINRHNELVVPILASLVKHDDTYQPSPKEHRSRSKNVALEWASLSLTDFLASWVLGCLSKVALLRSVDNSRLSECVTFVNLSGNQLRCVPVELLQLPRMTVLNLTGNHLESLPEVDCMHSAAEDCYVWPCHALSKVYLNKNCLKTLPEFLFSLPNLVYLDLSHNQLRELPFDLWKAPKLHALLCSHNELEAIPTNWPHVLSSCTVIDSSPSPKSMMEPPQIKKRRSMSKLNVNPSRSRDASDPTSPDKEKGGASEERESSDSPLISKLHDRLKVSNAHLPVDWEGTEGREEEYEGLAILNLSNNLISVIPENLPCLCPKLIRLDLSHNKISSISLPRSFPAELKQINLSYNQLDEIDCRNTMAKPLPCTNPQALTEAHNTICVDNVSFCVHRSHMHLVRLGVLEVTHCLLQEVNFVCPGPRKQTEEPKNTQYRVETMIGGTARPKPATNSRLVCPLVTRLILSHNQLVRVPESVCEMTSLNSLDLSHNDIIDLPAEMGNLSNLWEFPLAGLKLISPPQNIIERGKTKDIIGFLWSLLQRARPYHRMKLMLVGKADRGKTTLLTKISEKGQRGVKDNWGNTRMKMPTGNISTVGIVVSDWTYFKRVKESQTALKSITFMTWDFGGQEEYYATHQCFLSRRSLYLAVWNVTHGMRGVEELKPWLLNIQARAPNSPVIIVGTHLDKLSRSGKQELTRSLDHIYHNYGSTVGRKEGFPQIMGNMVVSCTNGRGIAALRDTIFDVASQVRENTVAGRGIGVGRISEYRLLMDQLVPASYLQLEDTVRNIALNMRLAGNPPVLNYKKLRNEVFADPRTLISKTSGNRELEQAVRFLHDNGTMLHFEDPLLNDFYFVDPQWLCDMLAHIVTVREINPFVRDGVMRIVDFPLIFNDMEFPIRWKTEYIRLLTTFEVAVELGDDQLLIPSALPHQKPNLPQVGIPRELKQLPPLRHTYIVPFIPSGFWPRLMSRLLTDASISELAREGCAIPIEESDQLTWIKWRTGLILQYGNLTLLSIEEIVEGMFPADDDRRGIMVFAEEQWQEHTGSRRIFGIDIVTPDLYPVLKFPEARKKYKKINRSPGLGRQASCDHYVYVEEPQVKSGDSQVTKSGDGQVTNRMVSIDQIDSEFEKLKIRLDLSRNSSCSQPDWKGVGPGMGVASDGLNGRISPGPVRKNGGPEKHKSAPPLQLPQTLLASMPNQPDGSSTLPSISEEKHDIMRAGLLSKAVDHISLLIEHWFQGVRPRTLIVPCPHCSQGTRAPGKMQRSYSEMLELLPPEEREERGLGRVGNSGSMGSSAEEPLHATHPYASLSIGSRTSAYRYAYRYNDCVVAARKMDSMYCPFHGEIPLQYMAPDTLFLTQGRDILVDNKQLEKKESIGRGAFATVFKATYKNGQEVALKAMTKEWRTHSEEGGGEEGEGGGGVDMRRLGGDSEEEQDVRSLPARPPTRHSIVTGFTNVKKELSILYPLRHPHVVKLFGVMLRPMGLVLELAPKGSLKRILGHYHEVHAKLQARAMQRVLMQVASAIQYLHQCNIIYRDLKSDNVLVWRFPEPRDSIPLSLSPDMGMSSVLVKLSDYGISQFVATQGARGMVGTAGFIAPEILKYHGKEVYDQQVDLFSFGMFLYELLTLHIPYESLAIQQANQANERGTRPSLTKRDFPCPVLVRELMVWCWQQFPDHRPSAETIIATARTDEFPRLLDGIRICNSGHVTATCMCIISSGQSTRQRRESRLLSPSPTFFPSVGGAVGRAGERGSLSLSYQESSLPQLEVVSEEGRESDNVFEDRGSKDAPREDEGATPPLLNPPEELSGDKVSGKRDYRQHSASFLQRQLSADELQLKRVSPYYMEEEVPVCEVWVASSDARHSTITVIDYAQQFTQIEDVEVGDSPVLCLCLVQRKVWMGMEMGCLMVYDANTRKPYLQTWIKHYKKMLSIAHLPPLHLVYVGLEDGSILAFSEDLPSQPLISLDPSLTNPPLVSLSPITQYRDSTQSCSCILAIPRTNSSNQLCGVDHEEPSSGGESYELWVGQKGNRITVLDAASLRVIKFLHNELDQSVMPTFVAYLSCSHLVYGCSSARGAVKGEGSPGSCDHMSVYSALYHGQHVTRWSAELKKPVDCLDCRPYAADDKDCSITALLFSRMELIVGLNCGLILILHPFSFALLCSLACHREHISSLLSLDTSPLQLQPATSSRDVATPISHGSVPSSGFSSDSSSPINMGCSVCRLSPVGSVTGSSSGESGNRLLSFGTGFKSYYDAPECNHYHKSGFLLVWDSESWPEPATTS